uniref:Uncharacterized protein n=1 Tax=Opuntia streptacantha TaxID=393608 RepID=A0A7C8YGT2_OPUST
MLLADGQSSESPFPSTLQVCAEGFSPLQSCWQSCNPSLSDQSLSAHHHCEEPLQKGHQLQPPSKDLPLILLRQGRMWLVHQSLQQGKNQHPQWLPLQLLF